MCFPQLFASWLNLIFAAPAGGLQGDVDYLGRPVAPLEYDEPKCGGREGDCGVSADENSCAHHLTLSPKYRVADPDLNCIRIQSGQWIRIQEGKNDHKVKKVEKI
jgi:hypothetical protein